MSNASEIRPASRRPMLLRMLFMLAIALGLTACRYQTIWSGAEFDGNGQDIRLAADEPLCGCLVLRNRSDRDIQLRSMLHQNDLGLQVLRQGETLAIRFDWAGPDGRDIYRLEGFDAAGARLNLADLVSIDDNGRPWRTCTEAACAYGPLVMSAGERRR